MHGNTIQIIVKRLHKTASIDGVTLVSAVHRILEAAVLVGNIAGNDENVKNQDQPSTDEEGSFKE